MAQATNDSGQGTTARDLAAVRRQLATWVFRTAVTDQQVEERSRWLVQLAAKEQQLSAELARLVGGQAMARPWVELKDVRSALPADGALVEIFKLKPRDLKGQEWVAAHCTRAA